MKNLRLIFLTMTLAFVGCNDCNCDNDDDFDLDHYYEPHVAIIHDLDDPLKHNYSVTMIVKNDATIYEKREPSPTSHYNVEYYFSQVDGTTLAREIKSYPINNEYELRMYMYPISTSNLMSQADSTNVLKDGTQFYAVVNMPPNDHPHDHPQPLHKGTIHRPGIGGGGGGGVVEQATD